MAFLPDPPGRLVVIGLEGWTDGGQAASDLARHLIEEWQLQPGPTVLDEDNYDLTVARPEIERPAGARRTEAGHEDELDADAVRDGDQPAGEASERERRGIEQSGEDIDRGSAGPQVLFPGLRCYDGNVPGTENAVRIVLGPEPHFGWRRMGPRVLELLNPGDHIVSLGVVAADVPHTRPLPVTMTSTDSVALAHSAVVAEDYEGPTGFMGYLQPLLTANALPVVTIWTTAPAYALSAPSPKAILSLLHGFEDLTGLVVPQRELTEEVDAWQSGTDTLVDADEDLADHVRRLEALLDASELPEASGDAIAREIERFLKRREA